MGLYGRVCQVGIESTVIGIDYENHKALVGFGRNDQIILFRRGGVTDHAILHCLKKEGIEMSVSEPVKHVAMKMEEAQVAPGQLITHYAPRCDAFLVQSLFGLYMQVQLRDDVSLPSILRECIHQTVLLDFNGILEAYRPYCLHYLSISETYSF